MSVMLLFGLALASLAYKQQVLATSAVESQYAFYAADAALECTLYADQQQNLFAYTSNMSAPAPVMSCDNAVPVSATVVSHTATRWAIATRLSLDSNKRCADVTIYKPDQNTAGTVYLFAQGYDVSCATVSTPNGARFVSRGINAKYGSAAPVAPLSCGTGGTVTESNGYCIHTFAAAGTFTPPASVLADFLIVGGGGGGGPGGAGYGKGGGGGAGGVVFGSKTLAVANYSVTVGSGGAAGAVGNGGNGGDSTFDTGRAKGGGGGGSGNFGYAGYAGGSGGGGAGYPYSGPLGGASNQASSGNNYGGAGYGNAGGAGFMNAYEYGISGHGGGGGGGAGGVGAAGFYGNGGAGGVGILVPFMGTYYGGGGGGVYKPATTGGGGRGAWEGSYNADPGTAGTGGGGGAGSESNAAAAGGSGTVIIRYLKP